MKRFLLALLFAGMALCIAGCDGSGKADAGQPASSAQTDTDAGAAASSSAAETGESGASDGASAALSALAGRTPDHSNASTYFLLDDPGSNSEFDVCAGDLITVEVENTAGSLDLTIVCGDETLYEQKEIKQESCVLEVDTDGHCVVTVAGHMARGHFAVNHYAMSGEA